jgi:hypothetical protein
MLVSPAPPLPAVPPPDPLLPPAPEVPPVPGAPPLPPNPSVSPQPVIKNAPSTSAPINLNEQRISDLLDLTDTGSGQSLKGNLGWHGMPVYT